LRWFGRLVGTHGLQEVKIDQIEVHSFVTFLLLDCLVEGIVPIEVFDFGGLGVVIGERVELYGFRVGADELLDQLNVTRFTSLSS